MFSVFLKLFKPFTNMNFQNTFWTGVFWYTWVYEFFLNIGKNFLPQALQQQPGSLQFVNLFLHGVTMPVVIVPIKLWFCLLLPPLPPPKDLDLTGNECFYPLECPMKSPSDELLLNLGHKLR